MNANRPFYGSELTVGGADQVLAFAQPISKQCSYLPRDILFHIHMPPLREGQQYE